MNVSKPRRRVWIHESLLIDQRSGMVAALESAAQRQEQPCELAAVNKALERAEAVYFQNDHYSEREAFDRRYLSACQDLALAPRTHDLADCRSSMRDWMLCVGARELLSGLLERELELAWFGATPVSISQRWRERLPASLTEVVLGDLPHLYAWLAHKVQGGCRTHHFVLAPPSVWKCHANLAWDELSPVQTAEWSRNGACERVSLHVVYGSSHFRPDSMDALLSWIQA